MSDDEARDRYVRHAVLARFQDLAPTLVRDLQHERGLGARQRRPAHILGVLRDLAPDHYTRYTREAEADWAQAHPIKEGP